MARIPSLAALLVVGSVFQARAEIAPQLTRDPPSSTFALLVAAETSLALDMLQTTSAMHAGMVEHNPLLGQRPSDAKILAYFSGCMFATAAGTYLLPEKLRPFAPALVLMLEIPQIAQNASVRWGLRVPFFF